MPEIFLIILLMAIVTFVPRVLPVLLLAKRSLPKPVILWLSYVPVAVLAALLAPALFVPAGQFDLALTVNPAFWVAIPTIGVAIFTRNLFATVLTGMALSALLRLLI
jgi:branched-subunit amino acid transport protein